MENSRELLDQLQEQEGASKKPPMLVVHISREEQESLDEMQGGPVFDPKTGLRDYSKLDELFRSSPEVRAVFKDIAKDIIHKKKGAKEALEEVGDDLSPKPLPPFMPSPADSNPVEEEVAEEGEGHDDDLALFPESLADFFDRQIGGGSRNKRTGLRQYGGFFSGIADVFRKVVGVAAPIIGALIGGPGGGALGGALGGAIMPGKGTLKNMAIGAGLGALGGWGAQKSGLQAAWGPGLAETLGLGGLAGTMGWLPAAGAGIGALGSAPGWGALAGTSAPGWGALAGQMAPSIGGVAGAGATGAATAAATSAPGWFGAIKGALSNPVTPLIAGGALTYLGHQQQAQEEKRREDERRDTNMRRRKAASNSLRDSGFFDELEAPKTRRIINPDMNQYGGSGEKQWFKEVPYAHGGKVEGGYPVRDLPFSEYSSYLDGTEKGQADNLYTDVPNGSYIIDASTVSDLGDGNSQAGGHALNRLVMKFDKKISRDPTNGPLHSASRGRREPVVPAALSAGEYKIDPHVVTAIGGGDNNEGANRLRELVKNVRKQKRSNPNELPPKAKDVFGYLPKKNRTY